MIHAGCNKPMPSFLRPNPFFFQVLNAISCWNCIFRMALSMKPLPSWDFKIFSVFPQVILTGIT